jgi:CPA1 family monovalent cation:H+ antiporter
VPDFLLRATLKHVVSPSLTIEFIVSMLIAASIIAVVSARLRIPYTVALVLAGLALGSVHLPGFQEFLEQRPDWLSPSSGLIIFLPALLFEGSLKIQFRHLRENAVPICVLAVLGVIVSTVFTGFSVHWVVGLPLLVALLFGSIVAATDPISVLAIFRDMSVNKRLSTIVEGESLFNDGTAVVLYGVLYAGFESGHLGFASGAREFLVDVLGGVTVGLVLGYVFSEITQRIDEPRIEITLTTILAYGSYLAAQSLQVSGVIATVTAGLMIGNFGARIGMSPRTRISLWSFWEYVSFVINSIVFLLIGLQVRIGDLVHLRTPVALTIAAVMLARMVTIYGLVPLSNLFTTKIPFRWNHVMVWGGMRGALSLALALSLSLSVPYRSEILTMTFGVVAFTIVFQGLTIKPLLHVLHLVSSHEDDYSRARVRHIAASSALQELEHLLEIHAISNPVYHQLKGELNEQVEAANSEVQKIYARNASWVEDEIKMARTNLIAAEKSSIEQALHQGLISEKTATDMTNEADTRLDALADRDQAPSAQDSSGA